MLTNTTTHSESIALQESIPAMPSHFQSALKDVKDGFLKWRIWTLLSWQDIRMRYRRSQLGPFWLTISMAITIYVMGILYGHLFRMQLVNYFPYLAAGMLTWNYVALLITEGTIAFVQAENYLKQMKLPYSAFVLRVISRCSIIFLHNIVVIIPLYFVFHIPVTWHILMIIPGLMLILLSAFSYGMIIAVIGVRFRDVAQLIVSVMQVIFFITPIMWHPSILPAKYQIWVKLNPFAQYVEIIRAPMISAMPSTYALTVTTIATLLGMSLAMYLLVKIRHRIVYWL